MLHQSQNHPAALLPPLYIHCPPRLGSGLVTVHLQIQCKWKKSMNKLDSYINKYYLSGGMQLQTQQQCKFESKAFSPQRGGEERS